MNMVKFSSLCMFCLRAEASIRFLKAKLRVMQEELDRLAHEHHKKVKCTQQDISLGELES